MHLSKHLILSQLAEHSARLGFNPALIEQRSPEWFRMRLGVITASKASDFLAGESTDTYKNYLAEKAAEELTGELPEEILSLIHI